MKYVTSRYPNHESWVFRRRSSIDCVICNAMISKCNTRPKLSTRLKVHGVNGVNGRTRVLTVQGVVPVDYTDRL